MGLSPEGDTEMEILFDDQFVVMAGSPTKWIRRRKLVLADLLNELWVLPPSESLPGQYISQAFRTSGFEPPRARSLVLHSAALPSAGNRALHYDASPVDVALRQTHAAQIVAS
jgi:DNA-binding transcriptional LysR family regulator